MTASDASLLDAPDHPTMLAAMRLASHAPSVHNTQPWRWIFDGVRLHLHSDTDRQLPAADPRGRQLVISCGAMLHHVSTVFAAYNWHTDVVRLPDPEQLQHLAAIGFRPWPDPPAEIRARSDAIHHRHTDRLPMLEPEGWAEIVPALRNLVSAYNIQLDVLDESARPQLATASEYSVALHRYDMLYQTELRWWTGHSQLPEGVPRSALISDAEAARVGVARTFPPVEHSMRRADLRDRARLVVLSSTRETVPEWLHTGETLSAVLLECTVFGLTTCALTHITETTAGRKVLASLIAHPGVPQVLIRIGTHPPDEQESPPTPRRPLVDMFTVRRAA
jgi:nitroreductase